MTIITTTTKIKQQQRDGGICTSAGWQRNVRPFRDSVSSTSCPVQWQKREMNEVVQLEGGTGLVLAIDLPATQMNIIWTMCVLSWQLLNRTGTGTRPEQNATVIVWPLWIEGNILSLVLLVSSSLFEIRDVVYNYVCHCGWLHRFNFNQASTTAQHSHCVLGSLFYFLQHSLLKDDVISGWLSLSAILN